MRSAIRAFDRDVASFVLKLPKWTKGPMEFFTLLGQPPFTVGIAAAVLGYGAALGKSHYVVAGSVAIATLLLTTVLKLFLRRARPVNDYVRSMIFQTFSFPSGHAAGSLVSFGLAALVIGARWPELGTAAFLCSLVISFLVGVSRIYLGAHYASDVMGGWIVGGAGLIVIATLVRW